MNSNDAPDRDLAAAKFNADAAATLNAPTHELSSEVGSERGNELGIPGLQPKGARFASWKPLFAGGLMLVTMAGVLGIVVWNRFGPQTTTPAPAIAVASDQLPPIRFDDPRAPVAIAPGAVTPVPSIAPLNGNATASETQAAPISLQRPGQGPMVSAAPVPSISGSPHNYSAAGLNTANRAPRDESPFISGSSPGAVQQTHNPSMQRVVHGTPVAQSSGQPINTATSNLEQYQSQLDGMVRQLQNLTDQAQGAASHGAVPAVPTLPTGMPGNPALMHGAPPAASGKTPALFGQLERSQTPRAHATMLGARSTIVPKGVLFQCALKTRIVSAVSGFVGCQVQRPVYSDDGKVVLIERGSHLDGEYRIVQVRPGVTRIPILWTRVRTPHGVTVDLDSPGTGPLGDSGITGEIDNRWVERIGAALLLSLIDDAIKLQISENTSTSTSTPNATVVMPNTAATTSRLAEKVLDSTINIPPLITAHQGSVVGVYVSRDLDFSGVYRLEPR